MATCPCWKRSPPSECLHFFPFQIRPGCVRRQPLSLHGTSWQRYPVERRILSSVQGCGSGDGLQIFLALRCHLDVTLGNMITPPPTTNTPCVMFSLVLCHAHVNFQQSGKVEGMQIATFQILSQSVVPCTVLTVAS